MLAGAILAALAEIILPMGEITRGVAEDGRVFSTMTWLVPAGRR
jgi:hypothetical protein